MARSRLSAASERCLIALATAGPRKANRAERPDQKTAESAHVDALLSADLASRDACGALHITAAGRSYLARRRARQRGDGLDPFLAQHADAVTTMADRQEGRVAVSINEAESPLMWLARRKGRDGQPLIRVAQLQAGERLRVEFTRGHLTPRITSSWGAAVQGPRGESAGHFTDMVIAARQRVRLAVEAVGPEFSGLLLDVCCFLKRLEDVERERQWPARSAKVVLQLGLDRLARHFGIEAEARGNERGRMRNWRDEIGQNR